MEMELLQITLWSLGRVLIFLDVAMSSNKTEFKARGEEIVALFCRRATLKSILFEFSSGLEK